MSALARYFHFHGWEVSGYDKTETVLTKALVSEGISVHYSESVDRIPKSPAFVVYTPAIPAIHEELQYYRNAGTKLMKRSEVLGWITEHSFNICVAGTHGKTTTTTMIAHLLRDSGYGCNAFLGGISANYNSNFWSHEKQVCVIEADEYDRSFLKLSPDIAVITAMDPDHLDIYGTEDAVVESFIEFSGKLKDGGCLFYKQGLGKSDALNGATKFSYHLGENPADVQAVQVDRIDGGYRFDVKGKDWTMHNMELHMGGLHNVENMTAAIAVAQHLGIEPEKIRASVASFRGVKRRFEYILPPTNGKEQLVMVDDYAHHPEELRALITSAKDLFKDRKCTVIFQPHLYTRTRDFADGFSEVLDMVDELILLPIYPARELPIEGVTSEMLLSNMKGADRKIMSKEQVLPYFENKWATGIGSFKHLVITAGAGDIDTLVQPLGELLKKMNA